MEEVDSILSWLAALPSETKSPAALEEPIRKPPSKRRRVEPLTPEASIMSHNSQPGSPSKRSIEDSAHEDLTPKPLRNKRPKSLRSESSCSLPASQSQYHTSTKSGQSSPLRDLNTLEHDENGLKPRDLSTFHPQPPSLEALLERIDVFAYAEGILPLASQAMLEMLDAEEYWDMKWARLGPRSNKHYSPDRDALGCTPMPDAVRQIVSQAAECSENNHPEVNWNISVHSRVLDMAFEPSGSRPGLIGSMGRVDFCIYIDPKKDPSYGEAESDLDVLSKILLCGVINHTDFFPLRNRPIALSIETKKPGDAWDKAKLQLGTWDAARWAFLRHLVETYKAQKARIRDQNPCPMPMDITKLPDFLPGIIIQGHDWNLVITTQQAGRTMLWQRVLMGSTQSTKGVYQIICCLQLLRQWAEDSFWPWLRNLLVELSRLSRSG
ncbi:hypothetical protein FOQG_18478 [Fusarium oxysporum f. sp. raphani 54005]|uniref:PD-(D/E)XK nuclease-like domain-containing protein n=1 Tax=Fusarium oxysporum f. sp. raphani 54005 TaxID=1089458 RepID=X0BE94_FUSOX|nr:hypothetical protein FOQG_18478 [Fusarium oxysporum f. sp. raphani 54005]